MTHLSTPELIRALGGADAICKAGCSCRGSYAGPERRAVPRHDEQKWRELLDAGRVAIVDTVAAFLPCPAAACDLFGPHNLHRDSEGFEWRQP